MTKWQVISTYVLYGSYHEHYVRRQHSVQATVEQPDGCSKGCGDRPSSYLFIRHAIHVRVTRGIYYSEAYTGWHALLLRRDVGNAAFIFLLQRCAATKDARSASRRGWCKVAVLAPWLPLLYKCYYLVQDGHKKPSHVHR